MRELNALLYSTIKNDSIFQTVTGASAADPRIYKARTPVRLKVSEQVPAYAVYYKSGSIRKPSEASIDGATRNDYVFVVEVYGKKDTTVETLCHRLERIFDGKKFETSSYVVGYTYASRGSLTWEDGRQLYSETVSVYLTHIITLNEAS